MIAVFALNSFVVAIAVLMHYESLRILSSSMSRMTIKHRYRVVFGVFGSLIAHAIEVWIFAIAFYYMHHSAAWGSLEGNFDGSLIDCSYFSFTTFTTLGFGDIEPKGDLRYLTGIEALTGLVLITWTASFLFYEMRIYWDNK